MKLKTLFTFSGYTVDRAAGYHLVSDPMRREKPLGLEGWKNSAQLLGEVSHQPLSCRKEGFYFLGSVNNIN